MWAGVQNGPKDPGRGARAGGGEASGERAAATGVTKDHYLAEGVLYVPEEARFERLLDMEEEKDLGAAQIYEHCFEISTKTERASTRAAPEPSSLASTRGRLGAAGDL